MTKYYYIAWSDKILEKYSTLFQNKPLEFKKGYFILLKDQNYCLNNNTPGIEIIHNGELVKIYPDLISSNKDKIHALYIKMKISEMLNNGGNIFFPETFKNFQSKLALVYQRNPELLI